MKEQWKSKRLQGRQQYLLLVHMIREKKEDQRRVDESVSELGKPRIAQQIDRRGKQADQSKQKTEERQSLLTVVRLEFEQHVHDAPEVGHLVLEQTTIDRKDSIQQRRHLLIERRPDHGERAEHYQAQPEQRLEGLVVGFSGQRIAEQVEEERWCVVQAHLLVVQCQAEQNGSNVDPRMHQKERRPDR